MSKQEKIAVLTGVLFGASLVAAILIRIYFIIEKICN